MALEDVSFKKLQLEEHLKSVRIKPGRHGIPSQNQREVVIIAYYDPLQSESKLEDLRDGLEKSDQLTANMTTILDSFTVRLMKLDETIIPVYKQTKRLTHLEESIHC